MRNHFLFDKVRWVRYPILSLLICPASYVAAENSPSPLDSETQPVTVAANNHEVEAVQQQRTPTLVGTVIDKKHNTLIGANIMLVQTKTGVITDVNLRFSVTIPEKGTTIEVSYKGIQPETICPVTPTSTRYLRMMITKFSQDDGITETYVCGY